MCYVLQDELDSTFQLLSNATEVFKQYSLLFMMSKI